ncbi:hypothetical protein [Prosthecobacter sp.]|uniref:hypothetical protein n=1 Tax=Prosthecobacter sp. TaxID=1965333 RepID=UPI0037839A81
MKFPRILRVSSLVLYAIFFGLGVLASALRPELPRQVGRWINAPDPTGGPKDPLPPPPPPRPTLDQYNEVLSDSLALVEAQHTFYVHVTHNTRFAVNVKELGSVNEKGGTVMVQKAYNASDAVDEPIAVHGYLFTCRPVVYGPEKKDGFAVLAFPEKDLKWPHYLSIIPDARGGLPAMSSSDTWEIEDADAAQKLRELFQQNKVMMTDLAHYSPESHRGSFLISNFKKDSR